MATNAYVTFPDGKLEVPKELQLKFGLHDCEQLEVSAEPGPRLVFKPTRASRTGVTDWSIYEGVLSGLGLDLNADLEAERVREIELDNHL